MAKRPTKFQPGLPTREQVLEFIQTSETIAGKREIAKAFGLKGQEKIALKALLKDMAEEGLIDGRKTAYHRMGGVPRVTVLRVVDIEDGEPVAIPDNWQPDDASPPPRIRLVEKKKGARQAALRRGDQVLARTEETRTGWIGHPMKKLPNRLESVLGVVEFDGNSTAAASPGSPRSTSESAIPRRSRTLAEPKRASSSSPNQRAAGRAPESGSPKSWAIRSLPRPSA